MLPKLRPTSVSEKPAVLGRFKYDRYDRIGESYVNALRRVPVDCAFAPQD